MVWRPRRPVGLILVACLLAGCTAAPEPVPPAPPGPEPDVLMSTVTWNFEGQAGDWVLLWMPFDATNRTLIDHDVEFQHEGSGDASVYALVMHPTAVWLGSDDEGHWWPGAFFGEIRGWYPYRSANSVSYSNFDAQMVGLIALYAASAAWNLSFEATVGDGPAFRNPVVERGAGARFFFGGNEAPLNWLSGSVDASFETAEPGWTHIELLSENLQPLSRKAVDVSFANGQAWAGDTLMTGYNLFMSRDADASGPGDRFGVPRNVAGSNRIAADYLETSYGLQAGIAHLPGADQALPAVLGNGTYAGWSNPFDTYILPPLPFA